MEALQEAVLFNDHKPRCIDRYKNAVSGVGVKKRGVLVCTQQPMQILGPPVPGLQGCILAQSSNMLKHIETISHVKYMPLDGVLYVQYVSALFVTPCYQSMLRNED